VIIELNPNQFNTLSIRFDNDQVERTITAIETKWNLMFPEKAFEFSFLDEELDDQYATFSSFGTIIRTFTAVAVLISCLGVYGLVLFVVQRKVKEIGVRKVLGASVLNILRLIYREFVLLVLVGFFVAIPLSYYLMNQWLGNFTYHISLDGTTYLVTLAMLLLITLLTISHQAIRASTVNPVNSLRSE
jgi:putative ABC transport system permease protein